MMRRKRGRRLSMRMMRKIHIEIIRMQMDMS
jgi:hypothetical protein